MQPAVSILIGIGNPLDKREPMKTIGKKRLLRAHLVDFIKNVFHQGNRKCRLGQIYIYICIISFSIVLWTKKFYKHLLLNLEASRNLIRQFFEIFYNLIILIKRSFSGTITSILAILELFATFSSNFLLQLLLKIKKIFVIE